MDIVMLGHSRAGKTSYMLAMYEAMAAAPQGFTVRTRRPEDHRALLGRARELRTGRYPDPSNQRTVWPLALTHNGNSVFDFVWRDYRGGALTESSDSDQAQQLRRDVASAGGLAIMIDSTDLVGGPRGMARVRPLVSTTVRLLRERSDVLPVVIVLTKWDLVTTTADRTRQAAENAFGGLIDAIKNTGHIHGALIPVSCGAQPMNVALPVLWCLYVGIAVRGLALQQSMNERADIAQAAFRRDTWWDRGWSSVRGRPSWREIGLQHMLAAGDDAERLEPLIVPSRRLSSMLDSIYAF